MSLRSPLSSARRTGLAVLAGALLIGAAGAPAWAAPGDRSTPDSTTATVNVLGAISLTGLPASVELEGVPGSTVSSAAINYNVTTNNTGGYNVSVVAADNELLPADTTTNPDAIPIAALGVREATTGTDPFQPLSDTSPVIVHSQGDRSDSAAGDSLSNDYQVAIPFVNEDTYSVTLDYVATTL